MIQPRKTTEKRPLLVHPADQFEKESVFPGIRIFLISILSLLSILSLSVIIYISYNIYNGQNQMGAMFRPLNAAAVPSIKPIRYVLVVEPNVERNIWEGDLVVTFSVTTATATLSLYGRNLLVTSQELDCRRRCNLIVTSVFADDVNDRLTFLLNGTIPEGFTVDLRVKYLGRMSDTLQGVYAVRSRPQEASQYMVVSNPSSGPRTIFPCLDTSGNKAAISLSVVRPKTHSSLSSMPLKQSVTLDSGLVRDDFEETTPVSPELVAFVILDYPSLTVWSGETEIRVWVPRKFARGSDYVLKACPRMLTFYRNYFQVDVPLTKLDLVGVPDFEAGGMSYWGLIMLRQTRLLVDLENEHWFTSMNVASTIGHEIAHQWFGGLLQTASYREVWLDEGLATISSSMNDGWVSADWGVDSITRYQWRSRAFAMDQLPTTHALTLPFMSDTESTFSWAVYDSITYMKSAAVLDMLRSTVGPETFQQGIHNYLEKYQNEYVSSENLWESFDQELSDISSMMRSWTYTPGFPYVTFSLDRKNPIIVRIAQYPFSLSRSSPDDRVWDIPVTYITGNQPREKKSIRISRNPVELTLSSISDFVLGNYQLEGYYRVLYDQVLWIKLMDAYRAHSPVLPELNRGGLLDDSFAFLRAGLMSLEDTYLALCGLCSERGLIPWLAARTHFEWLHSILYHTKDYDKFKRTMNSLLLDVTSKSFGNDDVDDRRTRITRATVFATALRLNNDNVLKRLSKMYKSWKHEQKSVDPDLRSSILAAGVIIGGQNEFDFLYDQYRTSAQDTDSVDYLLAVSWSRDTAMLNRLLNYSIEPELVRQQDFSSVVSSLVHNPNGVSVTWNFIKKRWDLIHERYEQSLFILADVLHSVFGSFTNDKQIAEAELWLRGIEPLGSAADAAARSGLELSKSNLLWLKQNQASLIQWFDNPLNCLLECDSAAA